MNTLTSEEVTESMSIQKEAAFRQCDKATRESGYMTKMTSVIDLQGFKLFDGDKRFFKCLGAASKHSSQCYPQLLGKSVIINAPSYFSLLYAAYSVFQPKSALEKMVLCPGQTTWDKSAVATCPFIKRMNGAAEVPPFLGGTLPLPPQLTPRAERADALNKITVSARSAQTVEADIPVGGCTIEYEVLLADKGIELSAHLLDAKDNSVKLKENLMEMVKIKADRGLVKGSFHVPLAGTVQLVFDNSYSILRSKTLEYRVEVVIPEGAVVPPAEPELRDEDIDTQGY